MVTIIKRKNAYHYLVYHSGRGRHERYLGRNIPADIESIKQKFEEGMYHKENIPLLERIAEGYSRHAATVDKKITGLEHYEFKIHHIYSTQRIEGGTMTLGQTRNLLRYRLSPPNTPMEHVTEAEQMEKMFDEMLAAKPNVSKDLILRWH